ncbi:MAG: hypothetical protein AB8I08_21495 [Sandaracinaceae bacterium]
MHHTLSLTVILALLTGGCFGTHADGGDGRCGAQDAFGEGLCNALLGFKFDGAECVSFSGCSCLGADCDATYNSLDACVQACAVEEDPPPPPMEMCAAQDAVGTGDCRLLAGWAFDGDGCVSVNCECVGPDCDAIFTTFDACETEYMSCLEPGPAEPSCAPEFEGDVPFAPVCRPGAERWYFTADGCVEGCACTEGEGFYGWPLACPPSYESEAACRGMHPGCASTPDLQVAHCDRGDIGCRAAEPVCPEGQVAEVVGTCWGECVALDRCAPIECTDETRHHCPTNSCEDGFCRR